MFPLINANLFVYTFAALGMPLAATSDEIQPWMIAAIAAGAVLALILILIAARKARGPKGEDLRETMEAARQEAVSTAAAEHAGRSTGDVKPMTPISASTEASAKPKSSGGKGRGKHAK